MKRKITTDLSKLTNIDEKTLDKLFELTMYAISAAVYESNLNYENLTDVDLGFGELLIKNDAGVIKTKFIPNNLLELDLKGITKGDEPTLKRRIEKSVVAKLIDLYKEII